MNTWNRAIAHIDADAFFASCEEMENPTLKGKPICVLSGKQGIVVAKSYAAKAYGIKTGTTFWDAKKMCKDAVFIVGNHKLYSEVSAAMFNTIRKYTKEVQIYSIDECFLDLTTLDRAYHKSFFEIAEMITEDVFNKVGISVSMGVATTKILAKLASKHKKPKGITIVPEREIRAFLEGKKIGEVCGIGKALERKLIGIGVLKILDFTELNVFEVKKHLGQNGLSLWLELQGKIVSKVDTAFEFPKSIMRTSSFEKPHKDKKKLIRQMIFHLDEAFLKLFSLGLMVKEVTLFVRYKNAVLESFTFGLENHTHNFFVLNKAIMRLFDKYYIPGTEYRSIGIGFKDLIRKEYKQFSLFDDINQAKKNYKLEEVKQKINMKYGRFIVRNGRGIV